MTDLQQFAAYLITRRRAAATIHLYVGHIRRLMEEHPGPLSLTSFDLERYIGQHVNWAPRTLNSNLGSIRVYYRWALRYGYIETDPTVNLKNVPVPGDLARIVEDDSILEALPGCTLEERAMLLLGGMAGLRRSEIAKLHTRCRKGDWLEVTGKGGKTRRVHLRPTLKAPLDELDRHVDEGYYFPGRFGGHLSPESVYAIITRLVKSNPHSLRHGAATAVYRGTGGDIRATQEFLGHKSIETTMKYVHVHDSALVRASEAADLNYAA